RTVVRATGPDRVSFLQGMLSNDVSRLAAGEGCPALLLTVQGRVTADLRLAALADEMLLDCDLCVRDALVAALEALLIADDVELGAPAEPLALIGVERPEAARVLAGVSALAPFAHTELAIAGTGVRVQRASEVRGDGFVLHVPAAQATAVWDALVTAGARPCGMEALEGRRGGGGRPPIRPRLGGEKPALPRPRQDAP